MDLPKTLQGNQHVIVFQDMFTKWPLVFAIPDQKTERVALTRSFHFLECLSVSCQTEALIYFPI